MYETLTWAADPSGDGERGSAAGVDQAFIWRNDRSRTDADRWAWAVGLEARGASPFASGLSVSPKRAKHSAERAFLEWQQRRQAESLLDKLDRPEGMRALQRWLGLTVREMAHEMGMVESTMARLLSGLLPIRPAQSFHARRILQLHRAGLFQRFAPP